MRASRGGSDLTSTWAEQSFRVAMPHMVAGGKLSEVEFLKLLGSYQWDAIGALLRCPTEEIVDDHGERLYSSFIDIELHFGELSAPEIFSEGVRVFIRHRVNVFAKRFVEGLFIFDREPVSDDRLDDIQSLDDLRAQDLPWAYVTNAFIARLGGNTKLKVFKPAGIDDLDLEELDQPPAGIADQRAVQTTGQIEPFREVVTDALVPEWTDPIRYRVLPESDLNGAGLLYYARYPAIMNYGERIYMTERLSPPLSSALNACLSLEHRKIYYFANASENEDLEVAVSIGIIRPARRPLAVLSSGHRKLIKLITRVDLYRGSDKALIASSLTRKAVHAPGDANQVLMEVERLLARLESA